MPFKDPEKRRQYQKEYREKKKEEIAEYQKKCIKNNEKIKKKEKDVN